MNLLDFTLILMALTYLGLNVQAGAECTVWLTTRWPLSTWKTPLNSLNPTASQFGKSIHQLIPELVQELGSHGQGQN